MDTILCHPREIFRLAIMASASAIVMMHNHPSHVIPHPVLCRMAHDLSDLDLVEPLSYAA
jgi:DNA repair protein RadC